MLTRTIRYALVLIAGLAIAGSAARAQTPRLLHIMGRLTKPDGTPVPDGTKRMRFSISSGAAAPNDTWSTQLNVPVHNGFFEATLGDKDPFGPLYYRDMIEFYTHYTMDIQVEDDPPMTPSLQMEPVPYALRAYSVDPHGVNNPRIFADGVITSSKISYVTGTEIAPGTISNDLLSPDFTAVGVAAGALDGTFPNPSLRLRSASLSRVSGGMLTASLGFSVDQQQPIHNGWATAPHWQSFTAGRDGSLSAVELFTGATAGVSQTATLTIYAGEGTGGKQLARQTITIAPASVDGNAWQFFAFDTPVNVTAGSKYTWAISQYENIFVSYNGGPGGDYGGGKGDGISDYAFKTYLADPTSGAVGVNSPSLSRARVAVADPGAGVSGILVGSDANVAPGSNAKILLAQDANSPQWPLEVDRAGVAIYGVRQDGSVFSASSRRLKDNITPLKDSLQTVMELRPVSFDWKPAMGGGHDIGLVAEQTAAVLPALTVKSEDGKQALGVRYDRLGVVAIGAIQQQQTMLGDDAARLAALNARLTALEKESR